MKYQFLEESEKLVQGTPLESSNEMATATPLLSEAALKAISNKATSQVIQIPGTMEGYISIYLAVTVRSENIGKGVSVMCKALNELADKGLIHSCLAPVSSIQLVRQPLQAPARAVFCFVLVPIDRKEEAEKLAGVCVTDGEIPKGMESLEPVLNEDEFLAAIRISPARMLMEGEDSVEKEIQEYLKILPEGTEVVGVTKCHVYDLSVPYEVRFRNPLMKAYKTVELVYCRNATVIDDKVVQFNLLRAVEYTLKDAS